MNNPVTNTMRFQDKKIGLSPFSGHSSSKGLLQVVICLALVLLMNVSAQAQTTWNGSTSNLWRVNTNWDGNDIPDSVGENALINLNPGASVVLNIANAGAAETFSIGNLTLGSNNTLTVSTSNVSNANSTFNIASLSNAGTITLGFINTQATTTNLVNVAGASNFNNTGTINVNNANTAAGKVLAFGMDITNTNNGIINVRRTGSGNTGNGSGAALRLAGSAGTFVNNGTINVGYAPTVNNGVGAAQITLNGDTTFGGTGSIVLEGPNSTIDTRSQIGAFNATVRTLTNGSGHTIRGAGIIGSSDTTLANTTVELTDNLNVVNDGLILSDTGRILIRTASTLTNSSTGRIVSNSTGVFIGRAGANNSRTFTNNGLLEARGTANITIENTTTTFINGEIRGNGTIIIPSVAVNTTVITGLNLLDGATLAPGDSENVDGTGDSTVGDLSITGGLTLSNNTTLDFQLGSDATRGITYDAVNITGNFTLNGNLDVEALAGFGVGTYRLFTFGGTLTDNGLTLNSLPSGFNYSLDVNTLGGGYVDLIVTAVPEPSTYAMMGFGLATLWILRRRSRKDSK
jgi:fibronectin-binding autotransporter adhesin